MIAAAGLGSRLGHGLPKAMVEVGGIAILSRLLSEVEQYTDRIHVVVGYREELVIQHCALHHRDVVLVRNPSFRSTQTIHSYRLGARGIEGPVLFLDGDCLIAPGSLGDFLDLAQDHETTVGLTPAGSENAVYASTAAAAGGSVVTGFQRDEPSGLEWASVLVCPPSILEGHEGYVYEALRPHLPLPTGTVQLAEVDTADDLVRAQELAGGWWPRE